MRTIPSTLLVLVTAVAAVMPALSQVRPTEPFGGRPFGAPPGTPPVDTSASSNGTSMGAPGMSSVTAPGTPNLGTPPAVLVAPVAVPAPPPPPAPAPPAPAPVAAQPNAAVHAAPSPAMSAGPTPMHPGVAMSNGAAPAAASMAQPFGGMNRNAPATVTASTTQQPAARGLPPDAPKLVISGSVYSPDPAKRILIVNGQMMREGADMGQGVVLHEVRQEGAVLGYKGSNYNVVF